MGWRLVLAHTLDDPVSDFGLGKMRFNGVLLLVVQERCDNLAVVVVFEADDHCERDGRVFEEAFFDLEGVDVLAAWW